MSSDRITTIGLMRREMRNTCGAVVYYLFFASQKPVAQKIVTSIFKKYRDRGKC